MYCREISPRKNLSAWEAHHGYWGLGLMLGGFVLLFYYGWTFYLLLGLGLWIFIDDVAQHVIQKEQMKKTGFYTTVTFWNWFPYKILNWIKK